MPKATLTFDLNEEQYEFEQAVNAGKFRSVLWDLDQYLRNFIKYPSDREDPILTDTMAKVRDKLHDLLDEHNVTLDE